MLDTSTGRGFGTFSDFGFVDPSVVGFGDFAALGVFEALDAAAVCEAFGVLAFALRFGLLGVLSLRAD